MTRSARIARDVIASIAASRSRAALMTLGIAVGCC